MVFFVTKNTFLVGCFEGDQIAHQLTRYANMKRVKKLFLIIKLSTIQLLFSLLQLWSKTYSDRHGKGVVQSYKRTD